jgi:hypothetical protein
MRRTGSTRVISKIKERKQEIERMRKGRERV